MNKAALIIKKIKRNGSESGSSTRRGSVVNGDVDVSSGAVVSHSGRLAHSLHVLLKDSSAMNFFQLFFQAIGKLNLLGFWKHLVNFRMIAEQKEVALKDSLVMEAQRIFDRYLDEESNNSLGLPRRICHSIKEAIAVGDANEELFDEAQEFVYQLFKMRYFDEFKSSLYFMKHELEVLNRSNVAIINIITCPSLFPILMEAMEENEEDRNALQFVLAAETFECEESGMSDDECVQDAMAIYEKFISLQAPMRLCVLDGMRSEVERCICSESGRPSPHTFTVPTQCVLNGLHKYRDRVIACPQFVDYIHRLHTSITCTLELPCVDSSSRILHTDTQSSSSSVRSFPRMDVDALRSTESSASPRNCSIFTFPTRSFTDHSSVLASVDEMGRYLPLYDNSKLTTPPATAQSKLKKKLRRYVNRSGVGEEEVAEEVARSIIQDVISSSSRNSASTD